MLLPMPMNMAIFKILILLNIFLVFPKASSAQELPALSTQVNILTINEFQALLERSKRWGEFGDQDEAGAVNLITPAKKVLAAKEVREGVAINLSNPMSKSESGDFIVPLEHKTFVFPPLAGPTSPETAAGDVFTINYHGALHSHMDGLAHFGWDGKLYNGFPFEPKPQGFVNVGLEHIASTGIFTRGLLVDMPDLYGLKILEPGTVITVDHLEAWEKALGITVSSGDVLLLRTGRWVIAEKNKDFNPLQRTAGLHASVGLWLKTRGVAAIGSDAISDVVPGGVEGVFNPVHVVANYALGMPLFDHLQLEELARVTKQRNRYTFLFTAAPLYIEGATGSPLTPFAHL